MARNASTKTQTATSRLRVRNDLEIYPQRRRARNVWVIKDPVSLRYFQFVEEEFEILRWLNGRSSLEQVKAQFEARFPPQRMTVARLHSFVVQLHRNGLVISDAPGQGEQLLSRHARLQRDAWVSSLSNPLAIRFRGVDPHPLLRWLYPYLRWIYSPWCFAACGLLVGIALVLLVAQFEQFRSRLPALNAVLSPSNLIWLAVALGLTKLLHEFGHALTCKHFGGECHEMGLMLLVFTPCLYCNVTDAWKLSSRWQRIAIAGAGIYVEVVLSSVCMLLWWFSQPGFFNTVCLNVIVVCSIGTVLLNGNPLLRYDGYYILSDLLEAPNLWQESRAQLRRLLSRFFWGIDSDSFVLLQSRSGWAIVYAVFSMLYCGVVVVSVVYLLYRCLQPQGLVFVAQMISLLVAVGIFSVPVMSVWRTLGDPRMRRQVKPLHVVLSSMTLLALGALCFLVPLPCSIDASVAIQPYQARRVYISVPGRLMWAAAAGDVVASGDLLASLQNTEVQQELESLSGQVLRQQMRVNSLQSLRGQNADFGVQLPAAIQILADLEQRQMQLSHDLEALSLVAPISGIVLAPPSVQAGRENTSQLRSWIGTPLDKHNLGCQLERRTLLCLIGQPDQFEAVLSIDPSAIQYVRKDQRVRLRLDIAPGQILQGSVSEISRNKAPSVPRELAGQADNSNRLQDALVPWADESYQAHVRMDPSDVPLLIGASGQAKIRVEPQSLSLRIYRFVATTFKPVM